MSQLTNDIVQLEKKARELDELCGTLLATLLVEGNRHLYEKLDAAGPGYGSALLNFAINCENRLKQIREASRPLSANGMEYVANEIRGPKLAQRIAKPIPDTVAETIRKMKTPPVFTPVVEQHAYDNRRKSASSQAVGELLRRELIKDESGESLLQLPPITEIGEAW